MSASVARKFWAVAFVMLPSSLGFYLSSYRHVNIKFIVRGPRKVTGSL